MSTVAVSTALDRDQLILGHMPQVRLLANRFHLQCRRRVPLEDLVSAGTIGLIQAVDRYDPRRGLKLTTLAEHRIRGAILDYVRNLDPLSRSVRRFQRNRDAAASSLEQRHRRPATEVELAEELNLAPSDYRRLEQAMRAGSLLSLEALADGYRAPSAREPQTTAVENSDLAARVANAISALPEPERMVIDAVRCGIPLREVARWLGRHESGVSQIKTRAIRLLRVALGIPSSRARPT